MTAYSTSEFTPRHRLRGLRCAALAALVTAAPICAQPLDNFAAAGTESRLELGRLALEQGELEEAQRLLRSAVQLLKIDKGLRTQTQLEPLRQLMWAEMRAAQWSELETSLEHFYWLLDQIKDSTLSSQLAIIRDLRQLNLEAAAHPGNPAPAKHFSGAQRLNWQALNFIEATVGEDSPRLVPWLYDGLLLQHLENRLLDKRGLSNYQYKTDGREIVSGWSLSSNEISRASLAIGMDLLDRIETLCLSAAGSQHDSAQIKASVALYRGDWASLNDRAEEAADFYAQAHKLWPAQRQQSPAPHDSVNFGRLPRTHFQVGGTDLAALEPAQPAHSSQDTRWATGFYKVSPELFQTLASHRPYPSNSCISN